MHHAPSVFSHTKTKFSSDPARFFSRQMEKERALSDDAINSIPNNKMLTLSKLKAFADDKLLCVPHNMKFVF